VSITTYDELKSSIADFLNRDDLTSVIPTFISLAETDMNRKVRHWRMEDRAVALLDTRYTALPTDFIEAQRVMITGPTVTRLEMITQGDLMDRRSVLTKTMTWKSCIMGGSRRYLRQSQQTGC
jgi:hypothetical protein